MGVAVAGMRGARPRGKIIRPSLLSMPVAMSHVLFGGCGVLVLVVCAKGGVSQGVVPFIFCLALAIGSFGLLYVLIWRYFLLIGDDDVMEGRFRRLPRQVVPRDAIARVAWSIGSEMGLFLSADGAIILTMELWISERQVKRIAVLLDRPFERTHLRRKR
jgi:hypothetical protein